MLFENIIFDLKPDNNLYNPKEGFIKGNMFKNEYDPYKNYSPCELNANDEKGELVLKIYEYDFALNDLSLYLDLHPDDESIYRLFKKYTDEQKSCVDLYEAKFGPLELNHSEYSNYMWEKGPWPFEGGNV